MLILVEEKMKKFITIYFIIILTFLQLLTGFVFSQEEENIETTEKE